VEIEQVLAGLVRKGERSIVYGFKRRSPEEPSGFSREVPERRLIEKLSARDHTTCQKGRPIVVSRGVVLESPFCVPYT